MQTRKILAGNRLRLDTKQLLCIHLDRKEEKLHPNICISQGNILMCEGRQYN
jgi:hypothetical protein